jgi:enoyl-CoA hydratase/carnithine racemase
MPAAEALARRICLSVRAVKEVAYRGRNLTLEEGLREELMMGRVIRTTEDSKEGPLAFAEKREPQWKGR